MELLYDCIQEQQVGVDYMKFLHHFHLNENFKWKTWDLQTSVTFGAGSVKIEFLNQWMAWAI